MNRKELTQVYYLTRELEMWERKLREMEASGSVKAVEVDGMPFSKTNINSDSTASEAVDAAEIREIIKTLKAKIIHMIREVNEFIASLDDPLLRMIINYRCVELMSWSQVAMKVGGGNTDESVRKYFVRNIE